MKSSLTRSKKTVFAILFGFSLLVIGAFMFAWNSTKGDFVIRQPGSYSAAESDWLKTISITESNGHLLMKIEE
ncbi:hypothetical protein Pla110_07260 [Polystyrenella longa]|uniref:Uncharacterized protein n=1 Tax=Polystyrenella longa TaxID=2528007 RepID=A0A518CIH6_9PLAN|nr:hypothetical protein [Polystyrenella longa]QDU79022.1 hypothetical protein Pla110_07260 [Polystyrenella longa]